MSSFPSLTDEPWPVIDTSPPNSLTDHLDRIEAILNSPIEFKPETPQDKLLPLLQGVKSQVDYNEDEVQERVDQVELWCQQLGDACSAAFARDRIGIFLVEVQKWGEWNWQGPNELVEERKGRVKEINAA